MAREAEIGSLSVSMSHEGGIANAVVVAMMLEPAPPGAEGISAQGEGA
jgi:hypothetical protein